MTSNVSAIEQEIGDLSSRFLAKDNLYVITTSAIAPPEERMEALRDHLRYIISLEKSGKLFAAGPRFDRDGRLTNGMIIVRADSFDEAEKLSREDPTRKSGLWEHSIERWELNEGSFTFTVNCSDQSVLIE